MSFSRPRHVPTFDSSQRPYEDGYWGSSGRKDQNGHAVGGIAKSIGDFLNKQQLPMYKDKPYNYAASRRQTPLLRRKRIWLGVIFSLVIVLYCMRMFSSPKKSPAGAKNKAITTWSWLKFSSGSVANWDDRREKVKDAFILSWDSYEKYAWGCDEYHPLSKTGRQMIPNGTGWIIVDALDTLIIMNLTSRLSHAREWISTSLNYDQDHEVNTFETTIRMFGGLLSAHYLSTAFPNMAPLTDDDEGKPGEDLYLEKATDLADRLLGAFDTKSGIPFASVNLKTLAGKPSHQDGGASSTAEAASVQLEMKYLAMLTGEKHYWEKTEKIMKVIDDNGMESGLLPIFIYADQGKFRGSNIRLGSRGDSYYEYLIKQYLQTSGEEPIYLDMWNQALAGVRKHLITYSKSAHLTILAERPNGLNHDLSPKMDHLVCFMPGTIALGATGGLSLSEAKKSSQWSKKQEEEMDLARELMKTCWGMYKVTATGLAPEITYFKVDEPPHMESDGVLVSADISNDENTAWKSDYDIKPQDSHNLQRPETVESLFYMWRITGDEMYREWGWEMFKSFVQHTAVDDGAGFTSLSRADEIPPIMKDNMESFWLAETLKYFYLLFSPTDLLPLDSIVINTEAHIFPRFKLIRDLKTGWERKPRDADGKIIRQEVEGKNDAAEAKGNGEGEKQSEGMRKMVKVVEVKSGDGGKEATDEQEKDTLR